MAGEEGVDEPCKDSAAQIKKKVFCHAESILHASAKAPQENQIASKVAKVFVYKHRSQTRTSESIRDQVGEIRG